MHLRVGTDAALIISPLSSYSPLFSVTVLPCHLLIIPIYSHGFLISHIPDTAFRVISFLIHLTTQRHHQRYTPSDGNSRSQAKDNNGEQDAATTNDAFLSCVLLLFLSLPHSMENTIVASERESKKRPVSSIQVKAWWRETVLRKRA